MRATSLFKKLLDVKGMVIENLEIRESLDDPHLVIKAHPTKHEQHRCGKCGRKCSGYDGSHECRRWRSLDAFGMRVFIEADTVRVFCPEDGIVTAAVPWARHKSRFTTAFEDEVAWMATRTSRSVVSEMMRISWNTVGPIAQRVYDELRADLPNPFDGLTCIGIDETSYKKGHKYITVVVNHDDGSLLCAAKGYGKEVLEQFFQLLTRTARQHPVCHC